MMISANVNASTYSNAQENKFGMINTADASVQTICHQMDALSLKSGVIFDARKLSGFSLNSLIKTLFNPHIDVFVNQECQNADAMEIKFGVIALAVALVH